MADYFDRLIARHASAVAHGPATPRVRPRLPGPFERIEALRADNKPTLPTTIGEELSTNPFLRWHDPAIRKHLGMEKAGDAEVFAEIRKRKDNF